MHEPARATAIPFSYNPTVNVVLVLPEDVNTETSPWDIFDRLPSSAVFLANEPYETPTAAGLSKSRRSLLNDALSDLEEVNVEAREKGFPPPADVALENAERILRCMYEITPRRFEVYPMPDGEIAIDAPSGFGQSVLLLCNSDGGALCLVNRNGEHRQAQYSTASALPDGFLREALADLES